MARLQNYIDEAYVPTGQEDIPIIAATLKVSGDITPALIDPCAADGETLLQLAAAWGITPEKTYGIEVNYRRHAALAKRLPASNTLLADITLAKCSQWAFDIAYVNPPYGDLSTFERWEGYFLNWISHRLRSGGVLYWVVPYSQVISDGNLTTLLSKYEIHQMWQTSLAQFRQVVVQAVKRPKDVIADAKLKQILGRWTTLDNVPLKPTQGPLTLALAEDHPGPAIFRTGYVPPETLVQVNNRAIAATTRPKTTHWHSVIPPSPAQIPAALTATGRTLRLPGADGERFIRATQVIYRREYDPVETTDEKGRRTTKRVIDELRVPAIREMNERGEVTTLAGDRLAEMIATYLEVMSGVVEEAISVTYNFDPTPEEAALVNASNLRRRIPNSEQHGLTAAQKHMAIANYRAIRDTGGSLIGGRMGTGKTPIAVTVAAMLEQCQGVTHTLMVCPPTLVKKWQREIRITHPSRNVRVFELNDTKSVDEWIRRGGFGVLASTRMSLGSLWEAAVWTGGKGVTVAKGAKMDAQAMSEGFDKEAYPAVRLLPQGQRPGRRIDARPNRIATYPDRFQMHAAVRCPVCGEVQKDKNGNVYGLNDLNTGKVQFCGNPKCRSALWHVCPQPKRVPLAAYIKRTWKRHCRAYGRAVKLFTIMDEAQEYKGETSARGLWASSLCAVADYNAGLTGTPHGGYTADTARMLARTNPGFRRMLLGNYGEYQGAFKAFARDHGSMRTITTERDGRSQTTTAAYSTRSTANTRQKELPSSAPSFILLTMMYATYFGLRDVADYLPELTEQVLPIPLGPMEAEVLDITAKLQKLMASSIAKGSMKILSACIHAMLQLPENPFKPYVISDGSTRHVFGPLKAVDERELLPKEQWLVETIQKELAAKRKVLVTLQMTDRTDITARLIKILAAHGIKAAKVVVEASKREEWLAKTGLKYDVLISHPQRVQTGLDLLHHPTIIIYQWDYSILRMLQVAARSYRMGQDKTVRVIHTPYADSAQLAAVKLLALKAAADATLTGDVSADDEEDGLIGMADTAFMAALGQRVLDEARRRVELAQLEEELTNAGSEDAEGDAEALKARVAKLRSDILGDDVKQDRIVQQAVLGTLTNVRMRTFALPAEAAIPPVPVWKMYDGPVLAHGSALPGAAPSGSWGHAGAVSLNERQNGHGAGLLPGVVEAGAAGQPEAGNGMTEAADGNKSNEETTADTVVEVPPTLAEAPTSLADSTQDKVTAATPDGHGRPEPGAPATTADGQPEATASTDTPPEAAQPEATEATDTGQPAAGQPEQLSLFSLPRSQFITDYDKTVTVTLSGWHYKFYEEKARPLPKKAPEGKHITGKAYHVPLAREINQRFILIPDSRENGRARGYIVQPALVLSNRPLPESDKDPFIGVIIPGPDRVEYVISAPAEIRIEG